MRLSIFLGVLVVTGRFVGSRGDNEEKNLFKRGAVEKTNEETRNNLSESNIGEVLEGTEAYWKIFRTFNGTSKDSKETGFSECMGEQMFIGEPNGEWSDCRLEPVKGHQHFSLFHRITHLSHTPHQSLLRNIQRPLAYMVKYKYTDGVNPMLIFGRMSKDLGIKFYQRLYHAVYNFEKLETQMKDVLEKMDALEQKSKQQLHMLHSIMLFNEALHHDEDSDSSRNKDGFMSSFKGLF